MRAYWRSFMIGIGEGGSRGVTQEDGAAGVENGELILIDPVSEIYNSRWHYPPTAVCLRSPLTQMKWATTASTTTQATCSVKPWTAAA